MLRNRGWYEIFRVPTDIYYIRGGLPYTIICVVILYRIKIVDYFEDEMHVEKICFIGWILEKKALLIVYK